MNAFIKTINLEIFKQKLTELKPDYLIMGKEAGEKFLIESGFFGTQFPAKEGLNGLYKGIPIYIFSDFPSEKIIFGVE